MTPIAGKTHACVGACHSGTVLMSAWAPEKFSESNLPLRHTPNTHVCMATQWQEQHPTIRQDHPDTKSERPSVCSD